MEVKNKVDRFGTDPDQAGEICSRAGSSRLTKKKMVVVGLEGRGHRLAKLRKGICLILGSLLAVAALKTLIK